jgi:large subunit ribosomal protein L24
MRKLRVGDDVVVRTGSDKGKRGTVLRFSGPDRVVVENVKLARVHQKENPQKGIAGGIVERELAIHVSNVALFNPAQGKGDRVGVKKLADGRKVRVFKSDGEQVDLA